MLNNSINRKRLCDVEIGEDLMFDDSKIIYTKTTDCGIFFNDRGELLPRTLYYGDNKPAFAHYDDPTIVTVLNTAN